MDERGEGEPTRKRLTLMVNVGASEKRARTSKTALVFGGATLSTEVSEAVEEIDEEVFDEEMNGFSFEEVEEMEQQVQEEGGENVGVGSDGEADSSDSDTNIRCALTTSQIFNSRFYSKIRGLPLSRMLKKRVSNSVCVGIPHVDITKGPGEVAFLIDADVCGNASDLFCDSLGRWNVREGTRTTSRHTWVDQHGKTTTPDSEGSFLVQKRYAVHPSAQPKGSLRKCLFVLFKDEFCFKQRRPFGCALLSYAVGEGCCLILPKHGNAGDGSEPYQRTLPSTMGQIAALRKEHRPSQVSNLMRRQQGGVCAAINQQQLPRGPQQIYDAVRGSSATAFRRYAKTRCNADIENLRAYSLREGAFVRFVEDDAGSERFFVATASSLRSLAMTCVREKGEIERVLRDIKVPRDYSPADVRKWYSSSELQRRSRSCGHPLYLDMTFSVCEYFVTMFVFRHDAVVNDEGLGAMCVGAMAFTKGRKKADYRYAANALSGALQSSAADRVRCWITDSEEALNGLALNTLFADPSLRLLCELHLKQNTLSCFRQHGGSHEDEGFVLGKIYVKGRSLPQIVDKLQDFFEAQTLDIGRALVGSGGRWKLAAAYEHLKCEEQLWNSLTAAERGKLLAAIGVVDDVTGGGKIVWPPLTRALYSTAELQHLEVAAQHIVRSGMLHDHSKGVYSIDAGTKFIKVIVQDDGNIRCYCKNEDLMKPVCEHTLALSVVLQCTDIYLRIVEEGRQNLSASQLHNANFPSQSGKKPGRRGCSSSARRQDRTVASVVTLRDAQPSSSRALPAPLLPISPPHAAYPNNTAPRPGEQLSMRNAVILQLPLLPTAEEVARMSLRSTCNFTQPFHGNEKFFVNLLSNIATTQKRCVSCRIDFPTNAPPPNDLIITHEEYYAFPNTVTGEWQYTPKKKQKRIMHCRLSCILARYHYFTTFSFLGVTDDVRQKITAVHRAHIVEQLGEIALSLL